MTERGAAMTPDLWTPDIAGSDQPLYAAIADAIAADIAAGRLAIGDRLPPQRRVAAAMGMDVSTISRGYAEAVRRNLVEAHVGRGTFVRDPAANVARPDPRRTLEEDPHMNMPPEPTDPALISRMQAGLEHVAANIVPLLRYQTPTGSGKDREVAAQWMQANGVPCAPERLVVTAGAHAAIQAALSVLRKPGSVVLCEAITYPGIRAICAALNLPLIGLDEDADGICPDALVRMIEQHADVILYLNPTLRNPTTHTVPAHRRRQIADILDQHGVPLIEDDAYQFVAQDAPPAIATYVPHLTWHVAGISKVFGAGLRLAYVQVPEPAILPAFVGSVRATHVMASPISLALLSTWMEDGTARHLQTFVRQEAHARQDIAARVLAGQAFDADPLAYNVWLTLPDGLTRAVVLSGMVRQPLGIMPSDAFTAAGPPGERLRVCLGGSLTRTTLETSLGALRDCLSVPAWSG